MSPLVDADWLAERLDRVQVIEVQYEPDVDEYGAGHVAGARHAFWKDLFWDPDSREFVTPAQMGAILGGLGVPEDATLVLYSGRGQFAVYGYWVYKILCGHPDVRVLNGGRREWTRRGHPLSREVPESVPVAYRPGRAERDDSSRIGRDELLGRVGRPGQVILDARYPEEYRGERVKPGTGFDHGAERYGHIPGARNLFFRDLIDPETFTVRPAAEIEARFRRAGAAPDQTDEVVAYCRLGHRASLVWFTMHELLGWRHVRVYDGSWTEWGSIVGSPITRTPLVEEGLR